MALFCTLFFLYQMLQIGVFDELPTIYFRGLDNLIATARSNKVAVCLGFQDFSQLNRDYGDKESKVVHNDLGVENLLFYPLIEIVRYSAYKHSLREV